MKKLVLLAAMLSVVLTGCWDLSEVEKLGIITAVGIDLGSNGEIKVTLQQSALRRQTASTGQAGTSGTAEPPFYVHTETGATVYETIQKIATKTSFGLINFAHLRALIISEELASSRGIKEITDFFLRNPEVRRRTWVLIAKKGQLDLILNTHFGFNISTGRVIDEMISETRFNSLVSANNLNNFIVNFDRVGGQSYTEGIYTVPKGEKSGQSDSDQKKFKYDLKISDTAVFRGDKLAGWFDEKETRGLLWTRNQIKGGVLTFNVWGKEVSTYILRVIASTKPVLTGGKIQMNIRVGLSSNVAESNAGLDYSRDETIRKIEELQNEEIRKEIIKAIDRSRELGIDVFGFGNTFFNHYPVYWKSIAGNWQEYYKNLEVNIEVSSTINQIGLSKKSQSSAEVIR